jgi:hypothetical protein
MPSAEPIYVQNAGLVLAHPFLPRLFKKLDVVEVGTDGKTVVKDTVRAVYAVQYLVDGSTDSPHAALTLNKILCGLQPSTPVTPHAGFSPADIEVLEQVLQAIIANWTAIRSTSVAGLRETFLQREGRIVADEIGWQLRVQRKTVDVLVDQIRWSMSVVREPWMTGPIYVTW